MKISARNQLKGTVKSIETGSVNAIVHSALKCGYFFAFFLSTLFISPQKKRILSLTKMKRSLLYFAFY